MRKRRVLYSWHLFGILLIKIVWKKKIECQNPAYFLKGGQPTTWPTPNPGLSTSVSQLMFIIFIATKVALETNLFYQLTGWVAKCCPRVFRMIWWADFSPMELSPTGSSPIDCSPIEQWKVTVPRQQQLPDYDTSPIGLVSATLARLFTYLMEKELSGGKGAKLGEGERLG